MWPFKKRTPQPEPEIITWNVPDEHVTTLCTLFDRAFNAPGSHRLQTYELWKFIQKIFPPEMKEGATECKIVFEDHVPKIKITVKPKPILCPQSKT